MFDCVLLRREERFSFRCLELESSLDLLFGMPPELGTIIVAYVIKLRGNELGIGMIVERHLHLVVRTSLWRPRHSRAQLQ
jgi:hypothetical protein